MQPQTVSGTAAPTRSLCSVSRKVTRQSFCLSVHYTSSFISFSGSHKHSGCVCGFRSNHNRSCAPRGLTGADYISSSGWGPLGSHAGAFTLCVNFTVSGRFCPISAVGLLVEINSSSQERMRPVLFCFFAPPSIYIYIHTNHTAVMGSTAQLGKNSNIIWSCGGALSNLRK